MKRNDPDRNTAAFTLAELLIVVAIIAVLVAIAIPVFASQLEKSREAVDIANVRAAYAEVMTAAISDDAGAGYGGQTMKQANGTYRAVVSPLAQHRDGWTTNVEGMSIGGVPEDEWIGTPSAGGSCTVTYDPSSDIATVDWTGGGSSGGGSSGGGSSGGGAYSVTPEQWRIAGSGLWNLMNKPNQSISVSFDENGDITSISAPDGVTEEQVRQVLSELGDADFTGVDSITVRSNNGKGGGNKKVHVVYNNGDNTNYKF